MKNLGSNYITGFKEGNTTVFQDVYQRYHRNLCYFVKKLTGDIAEAEDIVAETFVKLWNLKANFETDNNIKAFLYITARNASLNFLRYQKRQIENQKDLLYLHNNEHILDQEVSAESQLLEMIQTMLEELPPRQKEIMELILFEGLNDEEVAMRLNKNPKTVRNLRNIAIQFLRSNIDKKKLAPALLFFYSSLL